MTMPSFKTIIAAFALAAATPTIAQAAAITIQTPASIGGVSGSGFVVGYAFEASQDINITALGAYDAGRNGLASPASVGLYTDAGALLATATIDSSDALDGYFRFESIAPVLLEANTTYVLGSYSNDPQAFVNANYGGLTYTVDPTITLIRNRDLPGVSELAYPSRSPSNTHAGSFGPNFQFEIAAVPEPVTLGMLGTGLLGLYGLRRRRA